MGYVLEKELHLEDDGRQQVANTPSKNDGDIEDGHPSCAWGGRRGVGEGGVYAQIKGHRTTSQAVQGRKEQIFCWKTLKRMERFSIGRPRNSTGGSFHNLLLLPRRRRLPGRQGWRPCGPRQVAPSPIVYRVGQTWWTTVQAKCTLSKWLSFQFVILMNSRIYEWKRKTTSQ